MTITAAEFRVRLHRLGLNPNTFADMLGLADSRGIRHQATGRRPVTALTVQRLEVLEAVADQHLAAWADGPTAPRVLPRLNSDWDPTADDAALNFPPVWWHAIAARHIDRFPDTTPLEYEGADDDHVD